MYNLPNEVIQTILKQLPEKDLLNCAAVCKLFKEIIESYRMIKQIVINENCESSANLKRKYSKMVIKDGNEENILKAIQSTGDSIVEIKFELHSNSINSIASILNHFPNVQRITFYYVSLRDHDEIIGDVVFPTPQNLTLHFFESDPKIFSILTNLSISDLQIAMYGDTPYYDFNDLLPLMHKQKDLESFSMSGIFESNLMHGSIPKGDYHLKEFEISNSDLEEWTYLENFLNGHVESLEKLSFKGLGSFDPSNIIKACLNLKILKLEEISVNEIEADIKTLEQLSIDNPNQVIAKFPCLKKLFIKNANTEFNRVIQGSNITDLSVRFGTVEEIHCENVKNLTLTNIDGLLTEEFFRNHQNIENFKLENHFELDDALLEIIVSNIKNLKVLRIYGINNLTKRAFDIIKNHCKNLRVLDMKTWSQQYSTEDWECLFEINGLEIYTENFDLLY